MEDTKGIVKCVLGFILSIVVIVGGAFGLNVQVNVEDTNTQATTAAEIVTEEQVSETEEVVETEQSPAESTPAEDEEPSVDELV